MRLKWMDLLVGALLVCFVIIMGWPMGRPAPAAAQTIVPLGSSICAMDPVSLKALPACTVAPAANNTPCLDTGGSVHVQSGQQVQFGLVLNNACTIMNAPVAPTNLQVAHK